MAPGTETTEEYLLRQAKALYHEFEAAMSEGKMLENEDREVAETIQESVRRTERVSYDDLRIVINARSSD